ncbi:MAG: cysteine desulfurase NifS [Clostridiaceae bacterium]|nr:cysteine desulfurase NifS [Clostridiaceae bacterium]
MENRFVYADNAATTPVAAEVLNKLLPFYTTEFGNASTLYKLGQSSHAALENARREVALTMNAQPAEVFFVGCGTEADNLALRGFMHSPDAKGRKHLITTAIEHPAILRTAEALEKEGFSVTYLPVDSFGVVDMAALKQAITPDTALVSVMFGNNEVGSIEPVEEIGKLCHENGVCFHTDAVQAFGHVPIDVRAMNIDLLSLSGHKLNAPKGVGAIYIRSGIRLQPILTGGGQEKGRRSGTENIAGIVALGEAARIKRENMNKERVHLTALQEKLISGVLKQIPQVQLTGHPTDRLPGTASFVFTGVEGESIVLDLDNNGICAATGSACSTASLDPSHVLLALGLSREVAHGSLRLTLGAQNTEEDVEYILERLPRVIARLRAMSPVWEE